MIKAKQCRSFFYSFVLYLFVFALFSSLAKANEDVDLAAPTSAWLVGLATLEPDASGQVAYPCVMAAQYGNGYILRFAGDENRVLTMAIDFRQPIFMAAESYDVSLRFAGMAAEQHFDARGSAYDPATLIISFMDKGGAGAGQAQAVRAALAQGGVLSVTSGDQAMSFALLGVRNGLARLGRCAREQGRLVGVSAGETP